MLTLVIFLAGAAVGLALSVLLRHKYIRAALLEGRTHAYKRAANIARDTASFELADTEGPVGQRLERARIALTIMDDIRAESATDIREHRYPCAAAFPVTLEVVQSLVCRNDTECMDSH